MGLSFNRKNTTLDKEPKKEKREKLDTIARGEKGGPKFNNAERG